MDGAALASAVLQAGKLRLSFDCFRFDGRPVDGTGPAGDRHWSDEPPAGFSKESCCYNCSDQELQQLAPATCRAKIPAANFVTVVTGLISPQIWFKMHRLKPFFQFNHSRGAVQF